MNDMQVRIHFSLSNVAQKMKPSEQLCKADPFEIIQWKLGKATGTLISFSEELLCLSKKFLIQHIMGIISELYALTYPVSYLFTFKLTFRNNKLFLALYILNITFPAFTSCRGCRKTAKERMIFVICIEKEKEEWEEGVKIKQGLSLPIVYKFYN